jgi:protein-S-isoprenylcysteine O-methyltransferase Ste14
LLAFCLSVTYAGLGYALIAWKYQNFTRLGLRGRKVLVALHLWIVFSNAGLFATWVIHDYRLGSWHPFPLAGFGLVLAGTALILWALAHLRSAAFVPSTEEPLTEGPYAWVRHPVYAGGVLTAFGLAYAAGSVWIVSYAAAVAVLLHGVSRSEERELIRRYGQAYRVYAGGKGRFFPFRRPVASEARSLRPEEDSSL